MKKPEFFHLTIVLSFLFIMSCTDSKKESASLTKSAISQAKKPNIIYILADDLGFGELGVYGQEKIETPHIDALANTGMLFTQHYSAAPVCAPARYMLLTGEHSGTAYIRGNDAWSERGDVWDYAAMEQDSTLEGQRALPADTQIFPQQLQKVGYVTGAFGKWGLGAPQTNSIPTKMGFDFFYGFNCQRQAHNYFPQHLYKNENRVYLENAIPPPHKAIPDAFDQSDSNSYIPYRGKEYAPSLIFDELISFIDGAGQSPFFIYWATPLPHTALQAPQRWIDYYHNKFGKEEPYTGPAYYPSQYPRATYAAMISYLDENVGKLVNHLKKSGNYNNTLIIFTSDNGPTYTGGVDPVYFKSAAPFEGEYGRGKGFLYEGGIRVPMIASWPAKIEPGTKNTLPSTHYDVAATLGDLTGFKMPQSTDGISFLPTLIGKPQPQTHEFLYWEFPETGGQIAIRLGKWKLVRMNLKEQEGSTLELYDLEEDPREVNNVAHENPDVLKEMEEIFKREHRTPEVKTFSIPKLEEGLFTE